MTVVVDDPLIAGMAIRRVLPLHESSRRLRTLYPECPRVYGVAVMADVVQTSLVAAGVRADQRAPGRHVRRRGRGDGQPRRPPSSWRPRWPTSSSAGWSPCWSSRDGPGTPAWRTSGCTSTPKAPSTGSASSTRPCGCCRTIRASARAPGKGVVRLPSEAALADLGRAPEPPRAGTAVRPAARGQRGRGQRVGDVAHRRLGRRRARPPRCRCWRARARSSACVAARRCSTRSSVSACRCAAGSTRADGAGIRVRRIAGKVLRN